MRVTRSTPISRCSPPTGFPERGRLLARVAERQPDLGRERSSEGSSTAGASCRKRRWIACRDRPRSRPTAANDAPSVNARATCALSNSSSSCRSARTRRSAAPGLGAVAASVASRTSCSPPLCCVSIRLTTQQAARRSGGRRQVRSSSPCGSCARRTGDRPECCGAAGPTACPCCAISSHPTGENVPGLKTRGDSSGFVNACENASIATMRPISAGSTALRRTSSANKPG